MAPAGCVLVRPPLSVVAMTTLVGCSWATPAILCALRAIPVYSPKCTSGRRRTALPGVHILDLSGFPISSFARLASFGVPGWVAFRPGESCFSLVDIRRWLSLKVSVVAKAPETPLFPARGLRERTVGPASSRAALHPDEALQAFGNRSIRGHQVSCLLPFSLQLHPLLSPSEHRFPYPVHPITISTLPCPRCALLNVPVTSPLCHLLAIYFRFPTTGLYMTAHFSFSSPAVTVKIFRFSALLQALCPGWTWNGKSKRCKCIH